MPLNVYYCQNCLKEIEEIQKFSDPPLETCESCGVKALKKKIVGTSFALVGGGWYRDLYASTKKG